jgi:2-dehydro-3-deoxyphosphogluconate aldolase / (4S)-4-hydroxy-2-oxoglutarate aldolase
MSDKQNQIVEVMKRTGLVPLFSHDDAVVSQQMVEAAYRAGVRILEFTNRKSNALDIFARLVSKRHRYPDLMLGIGTVMDGMTTQKFIDIGADFIVSPILKPEMAEVCGKNGRPWIPGCATLTEIVNARELGAGVIKIFPGSVVGPGFVSSILPVVPDLKLMITGGVEANEENLRAWFNAGSLCVGLGSGLFRKELIENNAWEDLEVKIAQVLSIIHRIKSGFKPHQP